MSRPSLDVVLSPVEALPEREVWLVIDVLRATTTLTTFLERGGRRVLAVAELEEALAWRERLGPGWLTLGERGGLRVPGFDLGNSPLAIEPARAAAAEGLILCTSHGAAALQKAASGGAEVVAACARNARAALRLALSLGSRIGVLCAGRGRRAALDDTLAAGLLVRRLLEEVGEADLSDGALMALAALTAGPTDFTEALSRSRHAAFMRELGLAADLRFCAEIDVSTTAPRLLRQKIAETPPSCFVAD